MFSTLKIAFIYIGLGGLAGLIGVPAAILSGDIGPLYRVAMRIISFGLRAAHIHVDVRGREVIPSGRSCIFMCNHVSNLDPPVILPRLPGRCAVLLKKELMRIPILGTAMRLARFIPVERSSSREAAQQSVTMAAAALGSGLHILVFPEGTRSKDGRLASFKKGPFFLARETRAPIVPVAVSGTQELLTKGSFALHPGTVQLRFLQPIDPEAYDSREDLMRAVHESLASALPSEMQPIST